MAKLTKEEKAARKAARKAAGKGLWAEFKEFMNRGNAFMLAVGVVIGGAFTAIVSAFTSILLNAVTAAVPGGLAGLVTPIKTATAINMAAAAGISPDQMVISAKDYLAIESVAMRNLYVGYGGYYYFSSMPILNWGALINAVISFIIVGLVLFIIVKAVNTAAAKKAEAEAKARERYYEKHPEERPVPPEPGVPEPTEKELLASILVELKKSNGEKPEPKK